jgi:hypothetical protein
MVSLPGDEDAAEEAAWTGSDGRFSVPGIYAPAVRVRVDAPGRVPVDRPRVEVPASGDALAVDLLPGRTVRVRVEDAAGAPLADAMVRAALPGGLDGECPWWGEAREPGVFEIAGLPAGDVEIAVECGEAEKRFRHDTARPEAVVVLAPSPDGGKER